MYRSIPVFGCAIGAFLLLTPPSSAQAPPGYYAGVDTSDAASLRSTLHEAIDDHQRLPYTSSSTDTWDVLEFTDEDPSDSGRIIDIYKNASYPKQGGGKPPSTTGSTSGRAPMASPTTVPATTRSAIATASPCATRATTRRRGNKPFRNCDPGCAEWTTDLNNGVGGTIGVYPGQSNWTTGFSTFGSWEAWVEKRGDVARAIFYMDLRYEGGNHGGTGFSEPQLVLTDDENLIAASNTGNNESIAYMGILSVLLQWHTEDPVDAYELARNDTVFAFQGNRNPFIDHPEWVGLVYETSTEPAGSPWINEIHYDNADADVGEFVEIAGPEGLNPRRLSPDRLQRQQRPGLRHPRPLGRAAPMTRVASGPSPFRSRTCRTVPRTESRSWTRWTRSSSSGAMRGASPLKTALPSA